jgi:hypothetical protein
MSQNPSSDLAAAQRETPAGGMSRAQAKTAEYAIIALAIIAILMIFQPFSLTLFSWGCGLVVVAGLAFNLVPFCRAGVPARMLARVVAIVLTVLVLAAVLGILTANLYVWYLGTLS